MHRNRRVVSSSGRALLVGLVLIVALIAGLIGAQHLLQRTADWRALQAFPQPRALAEFDLLTADGQAFGLDELKGQWNLLFFGFTNCPDICPDTLTVLDQSIKGLALMRQERLPQVVFVSVDPDRDQGETLSDYVHWFNPDFRAVTGSEEQLTAFSRQIGAVYFRGTPDPQTGFYNVDHSASVLIVNPNGQLHGRFGQPLDPAAITADLFRLTAR